MKVMLMLYADEKVGAQIPAEDMAKTMESLAAYQAALEKADAFVATAALRPTWDARTLHMEGGELRVHDGPYAETREQFGGYFIIDVADMDAALDWAKRCPAAQWGPVEIRPYHPDYAP